MSARRVAFPVLLAVLLAGACKEEEAPVVYQAIPVERRDIVVSAQASGTIQPDTVVEVKSKASGEILELKVETGQLVKRGALMVRVDPRNPRNLLAQAQADLEVAEARLTNATSQKRRADELFKSQSITQQEHENALLDYANARAEVVRARVAVDDAQEPDGRHQRARTHHRHHHREAGGARTGDLVAHARRRRRNRAAEDGRPRPGPGPDAGGRDRHREDPDGSAGDRDGGRLPQPPVRGNGAQDRAAGGRPSRT